MAGEFRPVFLLQRLPPARSIISLHSQRFKVLLPLRSAGERRTKSEDSSLVGCYVVLAVEYFPTFRRNVMSSKRC